MKANPPPLHLIINPAAARGKARKLFPSIFALLENHAIAFEHYLTEGPRHATEIVRAINGIATTVIAVGGDGTVNEVINGIDFQKSTFGVIPAGTGDDFARILGIKTPAQAVQALTRRKIKTIDSAQVEFTDENGDSFTHQFVNTMGIGFDAVVAHRVRQSGRGNGILPYLAAVFQTLNNYSAVPARIRFDGNEISQKIFLATIGNGTTSGGGFILSPCAILDDGLLDLCLVRDIKKRRVFMVLPKTFKGNHLSAPEVLYAQAERFEIELDQPLPVHADGEVITTQARKIAVKIHARSLNVITNTA